MQRDQLLIVDVMADGAIDLAAALDWVHDPAFGACNSFIGKVRQHNMGRDVVGVSYDVFAPLARNTFAQLAAEARQRWGDDLRIYVAHAQGRLAVGGVSIVIAVGSRHRDESFRACRFLIEEIKHRAPIWKQEHYVDGDSEWVQGHALCQHRRDDNAPEQEAAHSHPEHGHEHCQH